MSAASPFDRFQFERSGFFVVDKYSPALGSLIFNRIVGLREGGAKPDKNALKKSRKEEQAKQAAEKEARRKLDPKLMFRSQTDLYSKFDSFGIPTHGADGEALPKSRVKKLKLEWERQKKIFE